MESRRVVIQCHSIAFATERMTELKRVIPRADIWTMPFNGLTNETILLTVVLNVKEPTPTETIIMEGLRQIAR